MNRPLRCVLVVGAALGWLSAGASSANSYRGQSYVPDHPAAIPGEIKCAEYDRGGEGVAYHDADAANHGSGELNPSNGDPLNEFRKQEGVDTSYTKPNDIDETPYSRYHLPLGVMYVGWTKPGEWLRYTVEIAKAGRYTVSIPYTANGDGAISLAVDGAVLVRIAIPSTHDDQDPVAWRQWHHWALLANAATLDLPAGRHVLTLTIEEHGDMNLQALRFEPAPRK
jgi:hypothetical protein